MMEVPQVAKTDRSEGHPVIKRSAFEQNLRQAFNGIGRSSSMGILFILLGLCAVLWAACPQTFPTSDNLFSVARQFSYIAVTAIGELMVIKVKLGAAPENLYTLPY